MIVKVGGVEVDYEIGSVDIDNAINERSTAGFTVIDKTGSMRFYKGQPVEIYQEGGPSTTLTKWSDLDLTQTWEEFNT